MPLLPETWPSPVGLCYGLLSVLVGQIVVILYFYFLRKGVFGRIRPIQTGDIYIKGSSSYDFKEGLKKHLMQLEGIILLFTYLVSTWMLNLMPPSYYRFDGGVNILHVILQLISQDVLQTFMHIGEHKISPALYAKSHKPHHRFTNPKMFDAFDGSIGDTVLMILVPLYITANFVNANVWSYMAFGTTYSTWLCLIHSEYSHPWDPLFRRIGFGTAGDHHVHHKLFVYNYGHLFTYWDRLLGTYRSPMIVKTFRKDI